MNTFQAGVQYNDLIGEVAADCSDEKSFIEFLAGKGIAHSNEVIIGYRIAFGGNRSKEIEAPGILVYLRDNTGEFVQSPGRVRAVEIEMRTSEFFSFFKRFDLVMHSKGLDLENTQVDEMPH